MAGVRVGAAPLSKSDGVLLFIQPVSQWQWLSKYKASPMGAFPKKGYTYWDFESFRIRSRFERLVSDYTNHNTWIRVKCVCSVCQLSRASSTKVVVGGVTHS